MTSRSLSGGTFSLRALAAGAVWLAVILASKALGASAVNLILLVTVVGLVTGLVFRRLDREPPVS